jgi:AraC-like DNA-binding protein
MTSRLVRLLERSGRDAGAVCRRAAVSLDEMTTPEARVPFWRADALLEACADELGAAGLALALLGVRDEQTYDAAGLVLMSSATFGEGLARALAYQRLWADGERFSFVRDARGGTVRFRHPGKSTTARAVLAELAALEVASAARVLVGGGAKPECVSFAHGALGAVEELTGVLGVQPVFEAAHNEVVFSEQVLVAAIEPPPGAISALHDALAKRALAALPDSVSLSATLRALLAENPRLFAETLASVARRMKVPPRTAQRRLEREGTSWSELVDGARRERVGALELVALPEKEIAYLVGFADVSALRRARRRWRQARRS